MNQAIVATAAGHPFGSAPSSRDILTMAARRPDPIRNWLKVVQNLQNPLERVSRSQAEKRCLKANHIRSGRRR